MRLTLALLHRMRLSAALVCRMKHWRLRPVQAHTFARCAHCRYSAACPCAAAAESNCAALCRLVCGNCWIAVFCRWERYSRHLAALCRSAQNSRLAVLCHLAQHIRLAVLCHLAQNNRLAVLCRLAQHIHLAALCRLAQHNRCLVAFCRSAQHNRCSAVLCHLAQHNRLAALCRLAQHNRLAALCRLAQHNRRLAVLCRSARHNRCPAVLCRLARHSRCLASLCHWERHSRRPAALCRSARDMRSPAALHRFARRAPECRLRACAHRHCSAFGILSSPQCSCRDKARAQRPRSTRRSHICQSISSSRCVACMLRLVHTTRSARRCFSSMDICASMRACA